MIFFQKKIIKTWALYLKFIILYNYSVNLIYRHFNLNYKGLVSCRWFLDLVLEKNSNSI